MARKILFSVGINYYKHLPPLHQLRYAESDAAATEKFLQQIGFEVVPRYSENDSRSFRNDLLIGFRLLAKQLRLQKSDSLWFFFSGHGARQNGYDYFLPSDGHPEDLEGTAIKIDRVIHDFKKCGAGNLVFIFDACRNIVSDHSKCIISQTANFARQNGVMVIFSCAPGEISHEIPKIEQGSFTHVLLNALKGVCKPETTTFYKLDQYLKEHIRELHSQYSLPKQTPWILPEPGDRYHGFILPSNTGCLPEVNLSTKFNHLKNEALAALTTLNLDRSESLWHQLLQLDINEEERCMATNMLNLINSQRQSQPTIILSPNPGSPIGKNVTTPIDPPETLPSTISIDDTPAANPPIQPKSDTAHLQLAADGIRGLTQPPVAEPISLDRAPADLSPTLPSEIAQPAAQPLDTPQSAPSTKRRTTRKKAAIEPTDAEPIDPRLKLATRSFSFEVVKLNSQGQEQSRETKQAKCFREDLGNGVYLEMVAIPGGEFMMGGSGRDESPIHKVTIQPFYFGRYAVTQEQWKAVLELPKVKDDLKLQAKFGGKMRPVEFISYSQAVEFCNRLAQKTGRVYRLPSEAEWEYACRAGSSTPYHFGEAISGEFVNFKDVKYSHQTKRVDFSKVANDFGLSEMHGNLLEWCADRWHQNYEQAPVDGSVWLANGDLSWGVTRGGSWDMPATRCTSSYRHNRLWNTTQNKFIGFRIALSGETS